MKLVSFSNKRPVTEQGSFLTVSQTEGKLRITSVVANNMDVTAGDYIAVGTDIETKKIYIYVGVKDEKVQVGNKLSETGQTFEFGSKNSWEELGGTTEHSVKYVVAEEPVEFDGEKFWELSDKEELEKVTRIKKEDEDKDTVNVNVGAEALQVEPEAEEGFTLD